MKTNTLAAILGFGFLAVGVMAFFWPLQFFNLWGDYYGTFNFHFVKDACIAWFKVVYPHNPISVWILPIIKKG